MKKEIDEAVKILAAMYKQVRKSITDAQWQAYLEEIKQRRIALDGVVLEDAELEETAKANLLARITAHAREHGKKI